MWRAAIATGPRVTLVSLTIAAVLTAVVMLVGMSIDGPVEQARSGDQPPTPQVAPPQAGGNPSGIGGNTRADSPAGARSQRETVPSTSQSPQPIDASADLAGRAAVTHVLPTAPSLPAQVTRRLGDQESGERSAQALPAFWQPGSATDVVSALMEAMTDEERVAQVFLLGWQGVEPSRRIMDWISQRGLGGVKVFGWNADDLAVLTDSIRTMQDAALTAAHAVPLFTATDQEGGWVRHVRGSTSRTPGNMAIGATGRPDDAYHSGYYIGRELRALGINMNFAPTVDVYTNPEAHVIGSRAFSDDPIQTAILGNAFFRGLEQNRVIATAKHFPGHGNASGDSHGILPVLDDDLESLRERELVPFEYLIRESVPAVMSGHLSFPNIIEPYLPASLSRFFNVTLLREELGFQGLMITDDLQMVGARSYERRSNLSFGELTLEALKSGADMVMLSETPALNGEVWRTVYSEYRDNPEFRERLDSSIRRILRTKLEYLRDEYRVTLQPHSYELAWRIPDRLGREFFFDHAARSVTMLREGSLPLEADAGSRMLLVGGNRSFLREGLTHYPGADTLRLRSAFHDVAASDRQAIRNTASRYDVIVFCLTSPATGELLELLREHDGTVIVLSTLTPAYIADHDWIDAAVAVYGIAQESFKAGFAALRGELEPKGTLPFAFSLGG